MQQECDTPLTPVKYGITPVKQHSDNKFEEDDQELQNMKELGDQNSDICEEDEDEEDEAYDHK